MVAMPSLALSFGTTLLVIVAVVCVVLLVLIIVAPWRRVRDEPPIPRDVETRLLLHRPNPEEETGELPSTRVMDLADAEERRQTGDFAELRDLDDQNE
jgi:hypothetical protein